MRLSGYDDSNDFWATRYTQMALEQISVHLTINQITSGFLPRPDPNQRLEHNRAIKPSHAEGFATYLLRGAADETGKWPVIVPALSLFTSPHGVTFNANQDFEAGSIEFGVVSIDKSSPVQIWDGQHRTLGAYIAVERINKDIADALHLMAAAERDDDAEKAAECQRRADHSKEIRRRLGSIVIPASIALETDKQRIAELFTDVADNARGINATALARLDQRNVFNRVATALYEAQDGWDFLEGKIDDDNAYVTQHNPYWTTYRDVAMVAQTAWLGHGARWTPNKEETGLSAEESDILANTKEFYEVITEAFPEVEDVLSGTIEPSELRGDGSRTCLLSSSTTIKALASAFHDLKFGKNWVDKGGRSPVRVDDLPTMTRDDIVEAFKKLPSMASGTKTSIDPFWYRLGIFDAPWVAPTARANNARTMSMAIVNHARGEIPQA